MIRRQALLVVTDCLASSTTQVPAMIGRARNGAVKNW